MAKKMTAEDRAARVKELFALIEDNAPEAMTEGGWIEILEYAAKFHQYSARNQMLIQLQHPGATAAASFKRWKELGRTVRKGEKAIRILAPIPYAFGVDEDGNRIARKDLDTAGDDVEIVQGVRFKDVPVFAYEQTEGPEIPSRIVRVQVEGKRGKVEKLTGESALKAVGIAVAEKMGLPVTFETLAPGTGGYTDHKRIVVNAANDDAQQAKTIAHEIAHVMFAHDYAKDGRDVPEIEAESVAFIVLGALGVDSSAYSFGYVGGWADFDGEKIAKVRGRVVTAAKELIAKYDAVIEDMADADPVETEQVAAKTEPVAEPVAEPVSEPVKVETEPVAEPAAAKTDAELYGGLFAMFA